MMRVARMVRLAIAILLIGGISPIWAQDARPDARLQFSSFSVGLLFGYSQGEGALTLIQGGGSAVLRNAKGVTLYLQNVQQGLELTLGGGGLSIVLTEPTDGAIPAVMENASSH